MRVLVTGGAGFLGSAYVRALTAGALGPAPAVTVVDALTYAGSPDNLAEVAGRAGFRLVRGDVCDAGLVAEVLPGHDAVVHFAAESHVDRSHASPLEFVRTNVVGTQAVLAAALDAGVGRTVVVSTDEVYGPVPDGLAAESDPLRPTSPYAASKAAAELVATAYHRAYGMDVVVTRGCNGYGPRQHPEKLVPRFLTRLLAGRTAPLYGDGHQVREWMHADDHARGVHAALERGRAGAAYNLGSGVRVANLELARRLLALLGAGPDRVEHVADRPGHDRRYALDSTAARQELGFTAAVGLDDGLAATVAWYRDHPQWWQPLVAASPDYA